MTEEKSNKQRSELDPSFTQPGYVYHQQTRPTGLRHARGSRAYRPAPRPTSHNRDPAKQVFAANIRTVVIMLLCMGGLLFASTYISKRVWESRKREASKAMRADKSTHLPKTVSISLPTEGGGRMIAPDDIRTAVNFAEKGMRYYQIRQYEKAIESYREALDTWPMLTGGWHTLGKIYIDQKKYDEGVKAMEQAYEADPVSAPVLSDYAAALMYKRSFDEALPLLQRALELDPAYAPAHYNLARCYMNMNATLKAAQALRDYLELKPAEHLVMKEMAFLLAAAGQYEKALTELEHAIATAPDQPAYYADAAAAAALLQNHDKTITMLTALEDRTSPQTAHQLFQQPAFRQLRLSKAGQSYEAELSQRAKQTADRPAVNVLTSSTNLLILSDRNLYSQAIPENDEEQ